MFRELKPMEGPRRRMRRFMCTERKQPAAGRAGCAEGGGIEGMILRRGANAAKPFVTMDAESRRAAKSARPPRTPRRKTSRKPAFGVRGHARALTYTPLTYTPSARRARARARTHTHTHTHTGAEPARSVQKPG